MSQVVSKEVEVSHAGLPVNMDIALGRHRHFIDEGDFSTKEDGAHRHVYIINGAFFVTELSGEHSHEVFGEVAQRGGEHTHLMTIVDDEVETDPSLAHDHKELIRGVFTSLSGDHEHDIELLDGSTIKSMLMSKLMDEEVRKSLDIGVNLIILDKERFQTYEKAAAWVADNGFSIQEYVETDRSFQFSQIDRERFNEASLKTVGFVDGVSITIGILDKEDPLTPKGEEGGQIKDPAEQGSQKEAKEESSPSQKEQSKEGTGSDQEANREKTQKELGPEIGTHSHVLVREEKLTEKDGSHFHIYVLGDGRVVRSEAGGIHRHALDSAAGNEATYQMSSHIHEVRIGEESYFTREDGEHSHGALFNTTTEDGQHSHELELSEETSLRSLNSGELWFLLKKNPEALLEFREKKDDDMPVACEESDCPRSNVDIRIEEVFNKAFLEGETYFRRDWGGIEVEVIKEDDEISIFYKGTRTDLSHGFSCFCNKLALIPADFSVSGTIGVRKEGGGLLTRASLYKIETDVTKDERDHDYFIELNDIGTDIEELSYVKRHEKLTEFYSENLQDDERFSVYGIKKLDTEGDFLSLVEESFKNRAISGFFLKQDNDEYRYAKSPELKAKVLGAIETEDGNFIYECGLLNKGFEEDAEEHVDVVGKTFSSGILAEVDDVITVEFLEWVKKEGERGAWSAARVIDVDYSTALPDTFGQASFIAKERGVSVERGTEDLVDIALRYINLWKSDLERFRKQDKPKEKTKSENKKEEPKQDLPIKNDLSSWVEKSIKTRRAGSFKVVESQGVNHVLLGEDFRCLVPCEVAKTEFGSYEIGVATDRNLEFFLKGIKLKGRFILDLNKSKDKQSFLLKKADDDTPLFDQQEISNAIIEASNEGSKWLRWSKPGLRPRVIEVDKYQVKKQFSVPIQKIDEERQIVFGVVLEPDSIDAQKDKLTSEEIEKAAHKFMRKSRVMGDGHRKTAKAEPVESFIAPEDFKLGTEDIKKGSWVLGVHVEDDALWKRIKDGELNSYSIGGFGVRE